MNWLSSLWLDRDTYRLAIPSVSGTTSEPGPRHGDGRKKSQLEEHQVQETRVPTVQSFGSKARTNRDMCISIDSSGPYMNFEWLWKDTHVIKQALFESKKNLGGGGYSWGFAQSKVNENKTTNQQMSKPVGGWVGGGCWWEESTDRCTKGQVIWTPQVRHFGKSKSWAWALGWHGRQVSSKRKQSATTRRNMFPVKIRFFFVSASSLNGLETQSFSLFFFPRVFLIISRLYSQLCIRHLAVGRVSVESNRNPSQSSSDV